MTSCMYHPPILVLDIIFYIASIANHLIDNATLVAVAYTLYVNLKSLTIQPPSQWRDGSYLRWGPPERTP